MMTHAYQEIYLNKAQSLLGDAFNYAINTCDIPGDVFVKYFVISTISKRMENGEPLCLSGKSGIEVAIDIVSETTGQILETAPEADFGRSVEYWIGWAVAYYQWYSGRKYSEIFNAVSFDELQKMYYTLHEADITKFVDVMEMLLDEHFPDTNLKRIRNIYGYSQSELSKRSGVGLRSIQMYEQRNKDINKANADTVYRLAKALGCTMEDLIEK